MIEQLKRFIAPLKRRVMLMIGRGIIRAINDGTQIQSIKASFLAGEILEKVERFQEYGFTSHPPKNSEAVAVFVGGNREHPIIVGCESRGDRPTGIAEGETRIYTKFGNYIYLKANGEIEVYAPNKITVTSDVEVEANAPLIQANATTEIEANAPVIDANATTEITADAPQINATATVQATITAPNINLVGNVNITGPVAVTGAITATGNIGNGQTSLDSIKSTYNSHTHAETGTTTQQPDQAL